MLAGHIGVALGAKAADRTINLGVLVGAALLLDVLLWAFVLAGWEQVIAPPDFANRHYLTFDFPFSHSLAGAAVWALLAATMWAGIGRTRVGAAVIALVVLSHWPLDALVTRRASDSRYGNASRWS